MQRPIEQYRYRGFILQIWPDEDPQNPIKDWDPLGTYACFGHHKHLGNTDDFYSPEDCIEYLKETRAMFWPLYFSENSHPALWIGELGEMGTGRWRNLDPTGWVFITREKILKEYSAKIIHAHLKNKICNWIDSEVKTYSQYLEGEVFGYDVLDIRKGHDIVESLFGIYDIEECEAKGWGALEGCIDERDKKQMHMELQDGLGDI